MDFVPQAPFAEDRMPRLPAHARIVVTRPAEQAKKLLAAIREAGGQPIALPLLAIDEPANPDELSQAIARLCEFDFAVLVSPTAISKVLPKIMETGGWPSTVTPVVVGQSSADALAAFDTPEPLVPSERFDSEGLLDLPRLQHMHGQRVLIFRGDGGRELLADTLIQRGAHVEYVQAYQRTRIQHAIGPILTGDPQPAWAISSTEALEHLHQLAGESYSKQLQSSPLFVSHQRIAARAAELGFSRIVVTSPGDNGMLVGLCDWFNHRMEDKMDTAPHDTAPPAATASQDTSASAQTPPPHMAPTSHAMSPAPDKPRFNWGIALGAVALVLVTTHWLTNNHKMQKLQLEAGTFNQTSRQLAEKSADNVTQMQTRLAILENKLTESQNQQVALESMYQELSRSRDEASLADIEQALMLANQHLQLAGNVKLALISLQNIDQRLQGQNEPQWLAVRSALAKDMESLKRFPFIDTVGTAVKINGLLTAIDSMPLVVEQPQPKSPPTPAQADANVVQRLWSELWGEIKDLIRVRRLDKQEPLLLSPEQAFFLRENLKLRLLDARMANLQRDGMTFQSDLQLARQYVERYFDTQAAQTKGFQQGLLQLAQLEIGSEPPNLQASLNAVRDAKLRPVGSNE
ncbi:uroporphyrinogen III methyltransferase/synthase [Chitinivorax tropicus]|uniref:Uroporphyrinogen III methyltransferase/synthase n=1 Tax=Chitinivorax tropicus TaxID=714531 RepID=A0A840MRJ2_9PROT|nr:fused uroporphyrinogen-III synthase HemD/membrane protein HemX [Chitinivorax tropicus]MBB5019402.1 uroporphyrinogen III methyltransferase/synthase [Chitinivorax tropicus]